MGKRIYDKFNFIVKEAFDLYSNAEETYSHIYHWYLNLNAIDPQIESMLECLAYDTLHDLTSYPDRYYIDKKEKIK